MYSRGPTKDDLRAFLRANPAATLENVLHRFPGLDPRQAADWMRALHLEGDTGSSPAPYERFPPSPPPTAPVIPDDDRELARLTVRDTWAILRMAVGRMRLACQQDEAFVVDRKQAIALLALAKLGSELIDAFPDLMAQEVAGGRVGDDDRGVILDFLKEKARKR